MGCNLLIHHMHMLLLIGSAILFTNQAHFLSPYENQPQPHRSKARGIVTNTATVPVIDHELFLQAKVPRPAKTRQTCQEFYGPQFLPLAATRSGHFLYRNSRLHPPDKYGGVMQKCLPPREFSPPYTTTAGLSSDPDNQF
jgi:hypothetical protein